MNKLQRLKKHLLNNSHYEEGPLNTPCLIWDGVVTNKGYGRITWENKSWSVHCVGLFIATGVEPKLHTLHKCDNRACWAEDHLFEGTNYDNVQDMIAKGRQKFINRGCHTLTEDQVIKIKQLLALNNHTQQEIANQFMCSRSAIAHIKNGNTWSHLC